MGIDPLHKRCLSPYGGDEKLTPVMESPDDLAVPAIVLGECRSGIHQSRHSARYERWLSR